MGIMTNNFDIIVIGGGLVGVASAYKIQKQFPKKTILILEKEKALAVHQSGRNSGVLHSGLYYKPGSYRAKNCVTGRKELVKFAKKYNITHDVCGKLVVATNHHEEKFLPELFQRGLDNGLEDLRIIKQDEINEIEPFVVGLSAIWVPQTGIINYVEVAYKLVDLIKKINPRSEIIFNQKVESFTKELNNSIVITKKDTFKCNHIISCAGLFSDRLAKLDNVNLNLKIVGFRGDYYTLTPQAQHKVNNLIYPVPNPEFPFLGVHFTRMTSGEIECGPNAVFTFKREGYDKMSFNLKDTLDSLSYIGTWRLFKNHWRFGLNEIIKSSSKTIFLNHLRKLIPTLKLSDIEPGRSGVRAMALGVDGDVIDDFKIVTNKNNIHVLNAPSPAATACLSIGSKVAQEFKNLIHQDFPV